MASSFVTSISPWISTERMESYRPSNGDDLAMVTTYLYNIALCEALYPSLHFLEVSLRNSLHQHIGLFYGSPTWYLLPGALEAAQQRDVQKATQRIVGRGKVATPGRVVSELNFGFWVSLLSSGYEARIWRPDRARTLKACFPNVPKHLRQRTTIYKRCNDLREFRNRVFHHESIWKRASLSQDHQKMLEAMNWISPEIAALAGVLDTFAKTFDAGYTDIGTSLATLVSVK